MDYRSALAEMIRGAAAVHGPLEEVVFLKKNQDCLLVFHDGKVLPTFYEGNHDPRRMVVEKELRSTTYFRRAVEAMRGRDPFSVIAFGYSGTGPRHFEMMLQAAGFRACDVSQIDPPLRLRRDGTRVRGTSTDDGVACEDGSASAAVAGLEQRPKQPGEHRRESRPDSRNAADNAETVEGFGRFISQVIGEDIPGREEKEAAATVEVQCSCGQKYRVKQNLLGKRAKCRVCGKGFGLDICDNVSLGRRHAQRAANIADQKIECSEDGSGLSVSCDGGTLRAIQCELEAAVQADPANAEYKYLLACWKIDGGLGKTGFDEVLAVAAEYPDCAEAVGYAANPDHWRRPLAYRPWNSQHTRLPSSIVLADRRGRVASVRDGCRRVVGFFYCASRHALGPGFEPSSRCAIRSFFMDTPYGPVVSASALIDTHPVEPFTYEAILNVGTYHPEESDLSCTGYWLLRLLAQQEYTYLVLAETSGSVYFNRKLSLDAKARLQLTQVSAQVARVNATPSTDRRQFQMAERYYTDHFSMDAICF